MTDHKDKLVNLRIIKAGMLSLFQDGGRSGHQAYGLPAGGALDRQAMQDANYLLEQEADHPIIEITLLGPEILFEGTLQIALTGADLSPMINSEPTLMYQTITVLAGDRLTFGVRKNGCRTYLGLRGRWQLPDWLGSHSALWLGGKILPEGSMLRAGDCLSIAVDPLIAERQIKKPPFYPTQPTLRLVPGPEFDRFPLTTIKYLVSNAFTLSADSSRMGCRLNEALPDYQVREELISSGIVPGTVQVLPSGRLVLLLADAQTTGGYPRVATVQDRDLDAVAQLIPGNKVRFVIQ